ncbi:ParB N-terminal domain-containing protein [Streptomyces boninensis]|uniref:ParB N-terminal domain-containing protein n=1 Tax=Streptomyces boninensis TaxID=2039455 RepID=UPI003B219DE3
MKIHPLAAQLSMLPEDELHDLAESIKAEGLDKPIVLDRDGVLIDGRNRLTACEMAGVEPTFTTYKGDDPAGLIGSLNVHRRQLSTGQRAMIHAMIRQWEKRSGSGHSLRADAKLHKLSRSRLSVANVVLTHAPDLAERARLGTLGLDPAYEEARQRKAHAEALLAQFERLRRHAPDLAAAVQEERLTLSEATTQYEQRQEAVKRTRQALEQIAANWAAIDDLATGPDSDYTREVLDGLTPEARDLTTRLINRA